MILHEEVEKEEISIGDFSELKTGIPESAVSFIFDLVSTKFYSDPIGSIVREITSNCFDANVESGSDKPVMINIQYDPEIGSDYIEFCDNGIGLNYNRMKNIFVNLFTSTKRETNDQIGGFGIGSKSPFAYTDSFFITTVSEGIRYEYIYQKRFKESTLTLLTKVETEESSGTKIKILIKNFSDKNLFISACNSQLAYFDNVYINCSNSSINNEYQIYEGDTFKYRDRGKYSQYLHIVIESVAYPISFVQVIGMYIELPFALKFKIGELDVTPNREQIQYTDRTKELINQRWVEFRKEISTIFKSQTTLILDNIDDYHNKVNNKSFIMLGENKVIVDSIVGTFDYKLKGFEKLKLPRCLFFDYRTDRLNNGNISKRQSGNYVQADDHIEWMYYCPHQTDKFNNLFIENGTLLKCTHDDRYDYVKVLGLLSKFKRVYRTRNGEPYRISRASRKTKFIEQIRTRYIAKFRSMVRHYLSNRARTYNLVTEEWIQQYREANRSRRVVDKTVISYKTPTGLSVSTNIEAIAKYRFHFYYMRNDDIDHGAIKLINSWRGAKFCHVMELNKTNFDKIKSIKLIHVMDYFAVPELQRYLQRFRLSMYLNSEVSLFEYNSRISNYHTNNVSELSKLSSYKSSSDYPMSIKLVHVDPIKHYDVLRRLAEYKVFCEDIKPLRYLNGNAPQEFIKSFIFKFIKTTKLNENYRIKTIRTDVSHCD